MLTCVNCTSSTIVQEEIVLTPHDDRLGGANVVFADKHITTNIMYDVCIKYRCLKCEQHMTYEIRNKKGNVEIVYRLLLP